MKDIDEQIAAAQKTVESAQSRLRRLKKDKAMRTLKAENEALKAENEALKASSGNDKQDEVDAAKAETHKLVVAFGKLRNDLRNEAKWNATGKDGKEIPLVRLDHVQQAIEKLLRGK